MTWFQRRGDARLGDCATENCGGAPIYRLEAEGVGSNYCSGCRAKIEENKAKEDRAVFGTGFLLENADGSVERIDPARIHVLKEANPLTDIAERLSIVGNDEKITALVWDNQKVTWLSVRETAQDGADEIIRLRSQLVEARDVNRRMDQSFGEIEVEARAKAIEECAEAVQLTECGYAAMRFQTRAIENIRTLATTSEKRNG